MAVLDRFYCIILTAIVVQWYVTVFVELCSVVAVGNSLWGESSNIGGMVKVS